MPLKMKLNLDYIFILSTVSKLEISDWGNLHCFNRLCQMVINSGNGDLLPEG